MSGAEQKQSIFLITGNIQGGKTSYLSELIEMLRKSRLSVGGFLAPGSFESGKRSGFRLKNIVSGDQLEMASTNETATWIKYRRFWFNPDAFTLGREWICENLKANPDFVFVLKGSVHAELPARAMEIVDIEFPLSAPIYTDAGVKTDINLVGFIDLLLKDADGNLLVVDNKTSKQKKSQDAVDDDLQMSAYSYLLAANGYVFPRAEVSCRFDVLRKLKTPKLEHYFTSRTAENRRRFAKIANGVLAGIEQRIFIPVKGWLCADCSYADACSKW